MKTQNKPWSSEELQKLRDVANGKTQSESKGSTMRDVECVAKCLQVLQSDRSAKSVTVFNPRNRASKHRIRLTRVFKTQDDFRLNIGKPNYAEREFLGQCRQAQCDPKNFWISESFK